MHAESVSDPGQLQRILQEARGIVDAALACTKPASAVNATP
jgi:hypothetical protein